MELKITPLNNKTEKSQLRYPTIIIIIIIIMHKTAEHLSFNSERHETFRSVNLAEKCFE